MKYIDTNGKEKNNKIYTKDELLKKYKNKYIDTYPIYDYVSQEYLYKVRSVKSKIWENHNLPEEEIRITNNLLNN